MIKAIEVQSQNVSNSMAAMEDFLKDLKEAEGRRDEEIQGIKSEVDSIKDMIPKVSELSNWVGRHDLQPLSSTYDALEVFETVPQ